MNTRVHQGLCVLLAMLIFLPSLQAQKKSIEFRASELSGTAFAFAGDSTAWPIIVSLAIRNVASNSFTLSVAAQKQLKGFAIEHNRVLQAREQMSLLIENGARVFASDQLDSVMSFFSMYEHAIREGSVEEAHRHAAQIMAGMEQMQKLTDENRDEAVDARLAQKTGTVDKRRGYLGAWQTAFLGDLFVAYDGVKTGEKSIALLSFVDGVDVSVDPNTTVIIRASKRDRLSQKVKRNMALVNGSLLTMFSEKAKETNDFSFEAGTSESVVKSAKFWASAKGDLSAKISNYEGTIDLSASNVRVTLQSNEGTIIKKGQPPLRPITLLPPPHLNWRLNDSIIYVDHLILKWEEVAGAAQYEVEASPGKNFDQETKRFATASTDFELLGIPLASTYVRLHCIDRYGLRGIDSPVYTIIRTENTPRPPILIDGWNTDLRYTVLEEVTIHGRTRTDVALAINGRAVELDSSGAFSYIARLHKPETVLDIVAQDNSGNVSRRELSIIPMDSSKVFQVDWNCPIIGGELSATGPTIEARGTAYPRVRVVAEVGDQKVTALTSPRGIWAMSLKPERSKLLRLTFESIDDACPIGSKTWKVR
ncbi:MAG TPA: FecR domain-containing protein [Candidatus Acidoferrales bacterium]|nr:FecR domain-containing protein [Candidatus Acidoferrales bacterium]